MSIPITAEEALAMYRPLVEDNDQAIPILLVSGDNHHVTTIGIAREALTQLADMVSQGIMDPPVWAMYSAETWIKTEVNPDKLHEGGNLEERHNDGDLTVGEGIMTMAWSTESGLVFHGVQSFMRTSTGVIWGEPETGGELMGGSPGDDLAAIVAYRPD